MVDEIRLAVVVSVIVIAIPTFIVVSQFKAQTSGLYGFGALHSASAAEDSLFASEGFATSNPELALYRMYDAQAADELERCSSSESQLCEGTIELIVDSCRNSQYDLRVCQDPRIEQFLAKT